MFHHVVMFKWDEDVTAEHVSAVAAALDGLVDGIPEIKGYKHGPDAGLSDQNFDYVVIGDFDSADDYIVYRDHPLHQQMIAELIAGRIVTRSAVQYLTD